MGEHEVLVVGAAGVDVKIEAPAEIIWAQSNPAPIRWGWGGVARNLAENLAHLGVDVQLMTALGDDLSGRQLLAHLHSVGIKTGPSISSENGKTAAYVALYRKGESLWVAFDDMAGIERITAGYLYRHRALFKEVEMICIDANLNTKAMATLFRLAERYDLPVCADPTSSVLAPRLRPYLGQLALLTPNRSEAEAILGHALPDEEALREGARELARRGVGLAVITLGAEGLIYATSSESGHLPTFTHEIIDLTGAGDALTAATAYGLLEELPPSEAVRLGLAAAAQTIQSRETVCPDLSLESLYEWLIV